MILFFVFCYVIIAAIICSAWGGDAFDSHERGDYAEARRRARIALGGLVWPIMGIYFLLNRAAHLLKISVGKQP